MGVLQAHGMNMKQIETYTTICSLSDFSIAEYCQAKEESMQGFSHSHEEYEFILPIKTIPILIYDKANYVGEVGYAYPVNPYVVHGIEFPLNSSHCIDITVSKELIDELKRELGYDNTYFFTRFEIPHSFYMLVHSFQMLYSQNSKDPNLEIHKRMILTSLIELGLAAGVDNRRPEKEYRKGMRSITLYIYEHYMEPDLSIEKLTELSGFSPAYFTKSFKVFMQETPIMFLSKIRISEAKVLMRTTKLNLTEIATQVGYTNSSTFTEAFKTVTGHTPSEYKKRLFEKQI